MPYYHRSDVRVPQNSYVFRLAQEQREQEIFSRRVAILQRPIQHNQKAKARTSAVNTKRVETKYTTCMSKSNIFVMSIRQHVITQIWCMGAAIRSRPHKQYILKINSQDAMRCSKHRFKRSQLCTPRWQDCDDTPRDRSAKNKSLLCCPGFLRSLAAQKKMINEE